MRRKTHVLQMVALSVLLLLLAACGTASQRPQESQRESAGEVDLPAEPGPASAPPKTATIRMVGDNLLHMPVVDSGKQADGSYNFDHCFTHIRDEIARADIAIINQETVLGGVEIGLSEYPVFNSPQEAGDAIAKAGFDVVMHANNHAMDRGFQGLDLTMKFWENYPDITVVGVHPDREDRERIKIVDANGIRVAILSYTTSLNGLSLPEDMPWLVDVWSEERVLADMEKARELSDFIIVLPHWGYEYQYEPSQDQIHMATLLAEAGADLIIGTHPHVLQPMDWITCADGGKTLVYYSLGNFISRQNRPPRMLGGMAQVTIQENEDGVIAIEEATIRPLVTHYVWLQWDERYTVYPIDEYTEELAAEHGMHAHESEDGVTIRKEPFTLEWLNTMATEILGENYEQNFCKKIDEKPAYPAGFF